MYATMKSDQERHGNKSKILQNTQYSHIFVYNASEYTVTLHKNNQVATCQLIYIPDMDDFIQKLDRCKREVAFETQEIADMNASIENLVGSSVVTLPQQDD